MRYEGRQPPLWLQRLITSRGGTNLYSMPRYRLVWGPDRKEIAGGAWIEWDKSLKTSERNLALNRPWRTVVDYRPVPKYGSAAWLLEVWAPPFFYGTPDQWYSPTSMGGTMLFIDGEWIATCGPYPHRGDYEDAGYTFPDIALTERVLMAAVGRLERARNAVSENPIEKVRRRVNQVTEEYEDRQKQFESWANDVVDDAGQAFGGQPMVGYGPKGRHSTIELCDKLGIRAHPGVS